MVWFFRQLTYRVKETELKKCSVDTIMWAIKTRGHQIRTPFDSLINYTHTVPCCSTKPKVCIWLLFKVSRYCISSLHSSIMYLQSQTVVTVSLKIKHPFHFENAAYTFLLVYLRFYAIYGFFCATFRKNNQTLNFPLLGLLLNTGKIDL